MSAGHFTATVRITKSEPSPDRQAATPRRLTEVASIVVRAENLENLRAKVAAHVSLVDGEIGDVIS